MYMQRHLQRKQLIALQNEWRSMLSAFLDNLPSLFYLFIFQKFKVFTLAQLPDTFEEYQNPFVCNATLHVYSKFSDCTYCV